MRTSFDNSLLREDVFSKERERISSYISEIADHASDFEYTEYESSVSLSSDKEMHTRVGEIVRKLSNPELKFIFVIGIGGSNLGAKAIYDALLGECDELMCERYPRIVFVDTLNSFHLHCVINTIRSGGLEPKNFVINLVSKSGGTMEPLVNFEILYSELSLVTKKDVRDRVVITTEKDSKAWLSAEKLGLKLLENPAKVGGRFSVFSPVGQFPLMLAGVDVVSLLGGANNVLKTCLSQELGKNPAALSAMMLFYHQKMGKNIHDTFFFTPNLESSGKWYRQLMAESIGKSDTKKQVVGMTPTVSIGSVDLHSVAQLYLGGPKDKVTTFVSLKNRKRDVNVPDELFFREINKPLREKSINEILLAILEGTKSAYKKAGIPFASIELDKLDEFSLGEFMQMKMIEIMLLGNLLEVDTFNQPHVELQKDETRKILGI